MGKTTTNKTSTSPSKFSKPYLAYGANALENTYAQNQPAIQNIANQAQSYLPQLGQQAFGANPLLSTAQGYAGNVLNQQPGSNSYLAQQIANTNADVANTVNGSIGTRGLTGGSAQEQILARELAKNETGLRYTDYQNTLANQNNVLGQVPALNSAQYAGVAPYAALAGTAASLPFTGTTALASGISGLVGGQNNSSTTQGQSAGAGIGTILGGLLMAGLAGSDRRLKRDISKIGELIDGLGVYCWRYIWGGPSRVGVMADEVERLRPWALGPTINGYRTVDYSKIKGAI